MAKRSGNRAGYALAAMLVFAAQVAIAVYARDAWLRPYGGDALAVVLLYLVLRAVTRLPVVSAAAVALAAAFAIEVGQYYHLARHLGLAGNPVARAVLGTGFDRRDFVVYALGAAAVLVVEWRRGAR